MILELIYSEIKSSKRAAGICDETILRICREESLKYKKEKDVIKAVKNRLYTIHGAFFPDGCNQKARVLIDGITQDSTDLKAVCGSILTLHASTNERFSYIEEFYKYIFANIDTPRVIMDIGCGFNPFSLPWMYPDSGKAGCLERYYAYDIDARTIETVNMFFKRLGYGADAAVTDIMSGPPSVRADAAFLFKLMPVLEQQRKSSAFTLLERLNARSIVVTFPVKSLSGREKGMETYYSGFFEKNIPEGLSIRCRNVIGCELIYMLQSRLTLQQSDQ